MGEPAAESSASPTLAAFWADADPFELVAAFLPGWQVMLTSLDGSMGYCDIEQRTIWIEIGLPARERRCTLVHEVLHALRGDEDDDPEAEEIVVRETARLLVPLSRLASHLQRTWNHHDLAASLHVDVGVIHTRIRDAFPDLIGAHCLCAG